MIVGNRAGGCGSIGTGLVAKSPPDGHAFVVVFDTHAVDPSLIANLPFDAREDLAPVMRVATGATVITGHSIAQPHRSFADVLAAAKANRGRPQCGTIGSGSLALPAPHIRGGGAGLPGDRVVGRAGPR